MKERGSPILRFVSAVHRRLVAVRAAERAGWGALAGCAAGLALTPVLLWRGEPALGIAGALLAAGAAVGASWGLARRPTRLQAAVEADRQLRLHDLIGTALAILEDARFGVPRDDPWMHSALAAAEARVEQVRPGAVVLARWGRRAWGGLGLAAALLLTLAMLSSNPGVTQATGTDANTAMSGAADTGNAPSQELAVGQREDRRTVGDAQGREGPNHTAGELPDRVQAGRTAPEVTPSAAGDAAAAGGGAARTQGPIAAPAPGASGGAGGEAIGRGPGAAGASADSNGRSAAPWRAGEAWSQGADKAMQALRSGSVPDDYRDLVGAYFQRP